MNLPAEPRRRGIVGPVIFVLVAVAVFVALGTWQVERKAWKEGLIAELNAKLSAQPVALPPRDQWPQLSAGADEFRRVRFAAEFLDQEALVYTSGSAVRPDVSGPGYWVLSPARLADGSLVVVNRGFVPEGRQDAKTRPEGQPHGVTEIVGAMRWPEPRGLFTPGDTPAKNLWFVRDPAAIATAKGWGATAPFYIDQEGSAATGGLPKVGPLRPTFPNNHLQYAITWYGLALVVLISGIVFLRSRWREFRT
jgi:surfeit locus 1 family protein